MEWKCSENINSPSGDQYKIFTRILQKYLANASVLVAL